MISFTLNVIVAFNFGLADYLERDASRIQTNYPHSHSIVPGGLEVTS